MGKWIKGFYFVEKKEIPIKILEKINLFANQVCSETYDRFSYEYERRVETIRIGKLSEEIFAKFLLDEYDFEIHGVQIDIKSSKDTKNVGFMECFNHFNFPVPADQEVKDVTISIIYSFDLNNFCICSAIWKKDYLRMARLGNLDVGNRTYRQFRLCKLTNGISVKKVMEEILAR